jgi:hypothetical protein
MVFQSPASVGVVVIIFQRWVYLSTKYDILEVAINPNDGMAVEQPTIATYPYIGTVP